MRPRIHPLPSITDLQSRLDYDPATGLLTWRNRTVTHPAHIGWNTRFEGKVAGTVQNCGYLMLKTSAGMMLAHRVAWAIHYGEWPDGELDHRDNDKHNNRIDNLRIADRCNQMWNRPGRNRLGYKGVSLDGSRYRAKIVVKGDLIELGRFDTPQAASTAYQKAAREFHGEFANTATIAFGIINASIAFHIANNAMA
jgi:hypothetical protein